MPEKLFCEECGKVCYTERAAGSALNAAKNHHHANDHLGRNKELPRRKYFCQYCHYFHLTSSAHFHKEKAWLSHEEDFYKEYSQKHGA